MSLIYWIVSEKFSLKTSRLYKECIGSLILLKETTGRPDQEEFLKLRLTKKANLSEILIQFIREKIF